MNTTSLSGFGRLHGVSKQAVAKWKADGYLVLVDGKIDIDASDDRLRGAKLGRYRGGPGPAVEGNAPARPARPAPTKRPVSDNPPPAPTQTLSEFIDNLLAGNFATVAEAEQIKANALAATRVQEWKEKTGALIDIRAAEGAFFDLARSLRDAWLNWPARVGPVLAAEIGADPDKVVEVLSQHVQHHLDQLGEPEIEGFRGEIVVSLTLSETGKVVRLHPHDPSWFQWPLLEAAIEGNIVADFPIINKSFNCSYSGHDL